MMASSYNPRRSDPAAICRFHQLQVRGPFQSQNPHHLHSDTKSSLSTSPPYLLAMIHGQGHYQDLVPKNTTTLRTSPTSKDHQDPTVKYRDKVMSHSSSDEWLLEGFEDQLIICDEVVTEDKMVQDSPLDQEPVFDMDL